MPRTIPAPLHPEAAIAGVDGKPTREFSSYLNDLFNALLNRTPVTGSVTFAAATTAAVTFATAEADANYDVWFAENADRNYWATSKTTAGFTANASASNSDTVRWMLIRG